MNKELLDDLDFIKAILVKANTAAEPPERGHTPNPASVYEMLYYIDKARTFVDAVRIRVANGEE